MGRKRIEGAGVGGELGERNESSRSLCEMARSRERKAQHKCNRGKRKSFVLRSIHDILSSYKIQEITMMWSVSIELAVLL